MLLYIFIQEFVGIYTRTCILLYNIKKYLTFRIYLVYCTYHESDRREKTSIIPAKNNTKPFDNFFGWKSSPVGMNYKTVEWS